MTEPRRPPAGRVPAAAAPGDVPPVPGSTGVGGPAGSGGFGALPVLIDVKYAQVS